MSRPARRTLAVLGLAALPVLTGCGLSPTGTNQPYDPSDGVSASVGSVQVRNLLVVGSQADQPGVVSGVLLNDGAQAVTVQVSSGSTAPVAVQVPAGGSVQLGAPGATAASSVAPQVAVVQLPTLGQPAGAVVALNLSSTSGGTTTVNVPVVAAALEYASITPSAAPTPVPASS